MDSSTQETSQLFPGGVDYPMYRLAFRAWILFFLVLVAIGLVNYLGTVLHWGR